MKNKIYLIFIIKVLFVTLSFAQNPKYYIIQYEHSVSKPQTIYSIDLITGQKEILFSEEHKILSSIVLPDQSRIFFRTQGNTYVHNTETQIIDTLSHLDYIEKFENITFIPATNEICLSFIEVGADYDTEYQVAKSTTISIDKDTYELVDTSITFPGAVRSVLSRGGEKTYKLKERTDGIWFESFNIRTFELDSLVVEGFENLENIYKPYFIDANNGYVFIGYLNQSKSEGHLVVCDPEKGKSISHLTLSMGTLPYERVIKNNGDLIFQDKDNFYVINHETGKLRKRLKFHFNEPTTDPRVITQGNAKLLIMGDTLYYFPKNPRNHCYAGLCTFEVGSGNINEDQTDEELLDLLLEDPNELYQKGWIQNEPTRDKYNTFLENAKTYLAQGDTTSTKLEFANVLTECNKDSLTNITIEAYALLAFNAKKLLYRLPEIETYPYLKVNFKDSQGNLIQDGSLKYYESGWKDAINNGDGTFNVETEREKVSLRMYYAGASQDVANIDAQNNTYTFTTINSKVQLQDSQGNLLYSGTVKYYASGWKDFGDGLNGEVTKELLPKEYSFRMSYGGTSVDKKQNIGTDPVVVFQTTSAKVQLQDSQGNLLEGGTVKYYAAGWKDFGEAINGKVTKELLPKEYSFRMSYGGTSLDKKQNIGSDPLIVFSTVNSIIRAVDGSNQPINNALTSYYASGWKQIGDTINGEITKELLPKEYSFRVNNSGVNQDKKQDINSNNLVEFTFE